MNDEAEGIRWHGKGSRVPTAIEDDLTEPEQ